MPGCDFDLSTWSHNLHGPDLGFQTRRIRPHINLLVNMYLNLSGNDLHEISLVLVYLPLPCDIYPRNSMTTRIKSILADLTYFILYFTYISLGYFTLLYFGRLQYTVKYLSIKKDGDSSHILNNFMLKCSTVNTTNKRTKTNFDFNPSLHWGVF